MDEGLSDALFLLFRVGILVVVFSGAKKLASESKGPRAKAYLWSVGVSLFLAALAWGNYGSHVEDADPIFGGGETVADFEPTDEERFQHALFIFVILGASTLVGTHFGLNERDGKK